MTSSTTSAPGGGVLLPPTQEQLQLAFDNSIWYTLSLWPVLSTAVTQNFGGPNSADKRDWMAGAVSTLLTTRPETDHDDLVEFLLQIMEDEFEVRVEDDSEEEVVYGLLEARRRVLGEGDVGLVEELSRRWERRGRLKVDFQVVEEEGEGSESEEEDVEMEDVDEEVPQLVPAKKERVQAEVDEEGFTKVVGRKKR